MILFAIFVNIPVSYLEDGSCVWILNMRDTFLGQAHFQSLSWRDLKLAVFPKYQVQSPSYGDDFLLAHVKDKGVFDASQTYDPWVDQAPLCPSCRSNSSNQFTVKVWVNRNLN